MEKPKPAQSKIAIPDYWRYLAWFIAVIVISIYWASVIETGKAESLSYTEFKTAVRQGEVIEVTIRGQNISGTLKTPLEVKEGEQAPSKRAFTTIMPSIGDTELMPLLEKHEVTVRAQVTETSWWVQLLAGLLPWILIFGLIYYGARRMQERIAAGGSMGGMFNFGKSRAKRFRKGSSDITFNEVAGLENAKRDLLEIVGYLKEPERYRAIGAKIPRGILLMGPPGTGKTLLAKAVAGEAGVPFFSISGSEFIEMFVGVGAARVRDMFQSAKQEAPAIIFIDELDSVGRSRGTGLGGGHDEREQTLNQILSEMDGFEPHETVVVLAATNRPDVLDAALLRPGRFDRKITLDLPRKEARVKILEVHTRHVPLAEDVDLEKMAARTVGFSGADLENLINEAALLAAREKKDKVNMEFMEQARDKIILGSEREGMLTDEEKKVVAYHEAGHALMALMLPEADPLDKVTIIPRGMTLGATEQTPEEERMNLKRSYLVDRLGVMLGGRVSERVIFGEVSSGAEADLKAATQLARRMVCQWGMSQKLGPVSFRRGEEHIFLGREMTQARDFSEHTARLIDEEIRDLVLSAEERAEELLKNSKDRLAALAEALLEHETLEARDIERIVEEASQGKAAYSPA